MKESESASLENAPLDNGAGAQKTIKEGIISSFQIINQVEAGLVNLAKKHCHGNDKGDRDSC